MYEDDQKRLGRKFLRSRPGDRPNGHSIPSRRMIEMANEKGLPLSRTERGIVARGRTVEVPDLSQSITVGFDEHGKPVKRAGRKFFGPSQEVELPAEEIAALRAHGF